MILRQPLPIPLGDAPSKAPPHLRLAIAVSIGFHVGVVAYVAYTKFSPPIVSQDPIGDPPVIVTMGDPPKPPPPDPTPRRPHVAVHDSVPTPTPTPDPIPFAPPPNPPMPDPSPVASFDPPRPPDPAPPRDPVIHNPRWISQPGADEFARFYPERAQRLGREGQVVLTCQVAASGKLHDCHVSGETPENYGFGQAAIQLARYMRIAPKTIDGQPVDGGILVEPISFRLK